MKQKIKKILYIILCGVTMLYFTLYVCSVDSIAEQGYLGYATIIMLLLGGLCVCFRDKHK